MRRKDLIDLVNALDSMKNVPGPKEWSITVFNNFKKMVPIVESSITHIVEIRNTKTPEQIAYDEQLKKITEKYADRDSASKPITDASGKFVVTKKMNQLKKEAENFAKKNPVAIEHDKQQDTAIHEYLEDEINIDFDLIHIDYLPDGLSPNQFGMLQLMLDTKPKKKLFRIN